MSSVPLLSSGILLNMTASDSVGDCCGQYTESAGGQRSYVSKFCGRVGLEWSGTASHDRCYSTDGQAGNTHITGQNTAMQSLVLTRM